MSIMFIGDLMLGLFWKRAGLVVQRKVVGNKGGISGAMRFFGRMLCLRYTDISITILSPFL